MKRISTTITRQDHTNNWFTQTNEPKSQDLIAFEQFMQSAAQNMHVNPVDEYTVNTVYFLSDENYAQWCEYTDLIASERDAHNTANGITVETTVVDVA